MLILDKMNKVINEEELNEQFSELICMPGKDILVILVLPRIYFLISKYFFLCPLRSALP